MPRSTKLSAVTPESKPGSSLPRFESARHAIRVAIEIGTATVTATIGLIAGPAVVESITTSAGLEISLPGGEGLSFADKPPNSHECGAGEGPAIGGDIVYYPDGSQGSIRYCADKPAGGSSGNNPDNPGNNNGTPGNGNSGNQASAPSWEQQLTESCKGQLGDPLLASQLEDAKGLDGSGRLVTFVKRCDQLFYGGIGPSGRPATTYELAVSNSDNNITPNQAQLDLIVASADNLWALQNPPTTTTELVVATTTSTTEADISEPTATEPEADPTTTFTTVLESVEPAGTTATTESVSGGAIEQTGSSSGPSGGAVGAGLVAGLLAGGIFLAKRSHSDKPSPKHA